MKAGEFFYIPANVPHVPYNPSESENRVTVIARTDPNEQESVTLLPHLDSIHPRHPRTTNAATKECRNNGTL